MFTLVKNVFHSPVFAAVMACIALVEFVIIVLMVRRRMDSDPDAQKRKRIKNEALKGDIDFDNIITSSFKSEELYKKLVRKYHPDRFVEDAEKVAIADNLAARITQHKHDYKALLELEKEAREKLG